MKSDMNVTSKNQIVHYETRRMIKSMNSGSGPIVDITILENPVNSYDSNGVIAVPISILGDEKRNLPIFCLLVILSESSERIRAYYTSLKRYFQGRSEEHTSELQSRQYLVCRLLLEKKNKGMNIISN